MLKNLRVEFYIKKLYIFFIVLKYNEAKEKEKKRVRVKIKKKLYICKKHNAQFLK